MKKIYLITNGYPYTGSEKSFLLTELRELVKLYDVTIITRATGEIDPELPQGIKTVQLGPKLNNAKALFYLLGGIFSSDLRRELSQTKTKQKKISCLRHFSAARQYKSELKSLFKRIGAPNIVYSYWGNAALTGAAMLRAKKDSWRIIARCHNYDLYAERGTHGHLPFKQQVDSKIDRMFLICQTGYDYYLENWSVSEPPICCISRLGSSNSAGLQPYAPSDTLRLVSCSHLVPVKRVDMIIEALSLTENIKIDWIHYGEGELKESLSKLAEEKLSSKDNISYSFAGYVDNTKLKDIYSKTTFDAFITTSESEGLPVSVMEAISFGIPVIATAAGGMHEIVGSDNGFLLPVETTASQVCGTITTLASLSEAERLALRASSRQKWEKEYCAEENAKAFAAAIKDIHRR